MIPWLAEALRSVGIQVVEHGDWVNRTRPGAFDPIGVLWHHTAGTSGPGNPHPSLNVVIGGRPDLSGPLCHALVDYHGVFHIISGGRANHAGETRPSGPIPAGSGNEMLIGWEIDYQGVEQAITPAQYAASVTATAAVLRRLGRDASYARGHRETSTTGKIDPGFVDPDVMRADVAQAMTAPEPPPERLGASGGLAVSWATGRLDVFGRGGGGQAYHNNYERDGATWPDWAPLSGSTDLLSRPVAASWGSGRLDVFAVGPDARMRHWWFDRAGDSRWRGPETIGTTTFTGNPAVVTYEPGRVDVFGRDTNGALRHNYAQRGGATWPGWAGIGDGLAGDPTAVQWHAGRWDVFAVDSAKHIRHWWYDRLGDNRWRGHETIGDTTFVGVPAAVSWSPGRIDLFGRDTNDDLRHNYVITGLTTWPAWETWGNAITSDPVAVSWANGRLDAFATDRDDRLRHWWFDRLAGHTIRQGPQVGDTTFAGATGTLGVVAWRPGRLDVFGVDTNDTMRHCFFQHPGGQFSPWEHLGGTFQ